MAKHVTGRIIEEQKNYYVADTPLGEVRVVPQGSLRKRASRICTGDLVEVKPSADTQGEGRITRIRRRHSFLPRPPVANMDIAFFVTTIIEPRVDLEIIDRFLVSAAHFGIDTAIVWNKVDLLDEPCRGELEELKRLYDGIGYRTCCTSAATGENIDALVNACSGKVACMAGLSGTGKSSLLNHIFPDRELPTGELSEKISRGTHTTTWTTLLRLPGEAGGYIADTPGLSFVDLPDIDELDLAGFFPEIEETGMNCRFNNCAHIDEPGCAVKDAVEADQIAPFRYENYHRFYELLRDRRRQYRSSRRKAGG